MDNQPSLIMALHARYEQAWEEFNRIDEARRPEVGPPGLNRARNVRLEEAKATNNKETDALRRALLYQVPTTAIEALILADHLHTTFGLTDNFEKEDDPDRLAFETGLDTLLDYLFGETDDSKIVGRSLRASERNCRHRRRLRTGITEQIDD